MPRPPGKVRQPAFPLDAPLFSPAELAAVSGLSRPMVDVWVSEGRLQPTRREPTQSRGKERGRKTYGRPMFSSVAIFKVSLALELRQHFGIGLSEWIPVSNFDDVADRVAGGNWMWAVARGVENKKPFKLYTFATYRKGKWEFDIQLGDKSPMASFAGEVPCLVIPTWKIYEKVYVECKKMLDIKSDGEQ